jgi:hypothetical protein
MVEYEHGKVHSASCGESKTQNSYVAHRSILR